MKFKNLLTKIARYVNGLKRPSKQSNLKRLQERGESLDAFIFRDATENDIPELGKLHAITWAQTYSVKEPNIQLRQYQWRKAFTEENDGSWFCIVVVNNKEQLVGFAKGKIYKNENSSLPHGDLNKIYLLKEYQRMGLGIKLFQRVVTRLLSLGVNDMTLFGVPQNSSCYFHEAMGGERLYSEKGTFDGGYQWKNLSQLSTSEFYHTTSQHSQ